MFVAKAKSEAREGAKIIKIDFVWGVFMTKTNRIRFFSFFIFDVGFSFLFRPN